MNGLRMLRDRVNAEGYTINARLKPALLAILPVVGLASIFGSRASLAVGVWSGVVSASGLTFLLAELGRDRGKREQRNLFKIWGGNPCVLKLRHRDETLNPLTHARYHSAGARLLGMPLPDPIQEASAPDLADVIYGSLVDALRQRTRDKRQFPLLFAELVSYGFRRNLWGLKPFALWTIASTVFFQAVLFTYGIMVRGHVDPTLIWLTAADCVIGLFWIRVVRPSWVKIVSDSYAERLLEAIEILSPTPSRVQRTQQEAKAGRKPRTGSRTETAGAKNSVSDEQRPSGTS
jgi:hypothetical protein